MTSYVKIAPLELRNKRVFKKLPKDVRNAIKGMPPEVDPYGYPTMLSMLRYNLMEYLANFYKKTMNGQRDESAPFLLKFIGFEERVPETFENMAITPYEALGITDPANSKPPTWFESWTLNGLISLEEMRIMETGITAIILSNNILRQVNVGLTALQLTEKEIEWGSVLEFDPIMNTLLNSRIDMDLVVSVEIASGYLADTIEERYNSTYYSTPNKAVKDQMLNFSTFLISELGGKNDNVARVIIDKIVNY